MYGEPIKEEEADLEVVGDEEEKPKEVDVPSAEEQEQGDEVPSRRLVEPVLGDMTPLIMEEDKQWETHAGMKN